MCLELITFRNSTQGDVRLAIYKIIPTRRLNQLSYKYAVANIIAGAKFLFTSFCQK